MRRRQNFEKVIIYNSHVAALIEPSFCFLRNLDLIKYEEKKSRSLHLLHVIVSNLLHLVRQENDVEKWLCDNDLNSIW